MQSNSVIRRMAVQAPERLAAETIRLLTLADALAEAVEGLANHQDRVPCEDEMLRLARAYLTARAAGGA
jgi:hypothetical protein